MVRADLINVASSTLRFGSCVFEVELPPETAEIMIPIAAVVALLLAAGALYQVIGARVGARRYAAPGTMIDVEGQRLHVVCAGNGQPGVLFESGIAASSLSWTRVLRDVAAFT